MENNERMEKQTLDKMKRSLSIQEIFSKEWKIGLATLFCQKNENEVVTGIFIGEECIRKEAQAQQTTARQHTYVARRFAPNRATARRQGSTARRFAHYRVSAQRQRQGVRQCFLLVFGRPTVEFGRWAVHRLFFSSFSSSFLSLRTSTSTPFFTSTKTAVKKCKTSIISLKTAFDSLLTHLLSFTWF